MSNTVTQVVALFGAGVASFLAPCIVPLVPAYLGIIVGEMGDAHDPARAVPATLLFIAGFTTVFAGLGATAGLLGSSLSTFQNSVRVVGGIVIIVMGLALLGVVARTVRPRAPADPDAAQGHRRRPAVRRRHRVRRGLEPVRRAVARRRARRSPPASARGRPRHAAAERLRGRDRRAVPARRARPRVVAGARAHGSDAPGPTLERVAGVLLVALGVLLATDTYQHLTSYLARFVPAVHGL